MCTQTVRPLLFVALVLAAACSGGGSASSAGQVVGPAGGTVSEHGVTIEIPPGALAADVEITVTEADDAFAPPEDAVEAGQTFELGPEGTTFAMPVTVTLPFDASKVPADREVILFHGVGDDWVELGGRGTSGATVRGEALGFSPFRPFARLVARAPSITEGPRDRTVLEGVTATFAVSAVGGTAYQWEAMPPGSAGFAPLAGETAPSLSFPAALADDGTLYRVVVSSAGGGTTSNAALLHVILSSQGATVFVQNAAGVTTDPALATQVGAESATADLGAGMFPATCTGGASGANSYSGILSLTLFNNTGAAVTIAAGDLRVHVEGSYTLTVQPDSYSGTICEAILDVQTDPTHYVARGAHQLSRTYDSAGNVTNTANDFTEVFDPNGGSVSLSAATVGGLDMDLVVPSFVLDAGESVRVGFSLVTAAFSATAQFTTTPATITLTLPAGVTLDSDASVPLNWVITPP